MSYVLDMGSCARTSRASGLQSMKYSQSFQWCQPCHMGDTNKKRKRDLH